jgi:hypothetical protein
MSDQDIFHTPDQGAERLAAELRDVKLVLRDLLRKVTNIESRARRAFPAAFPMSKPQKKNKSVVALQPTMSTEQVMQVYDEIVGLAKSGDANGAKVRLDMLDIGDLNLLRTELGVSIGKRKPTKAPLVEGILRRVNESVMLTRHTNRQEMLAHEKPGDGEKNTTAEEKQ